MRNIKLLLVLLVLCLIVLSLSGCADSQTVTECVTDSPSGFWGGLWHGLIVPISFIGSLFDKDIAIYAINNNGGWYDFGFSLGVGALFSGTRD